ncbi:TPA: hypothetical protein HA246_01495 [Candidatus Woesearchaeota archaeon]|nr:hypothetical protein [Candidatus Woesearchaeota archaeon]
MVKKLETLLDENLVISVKCESEIEVTKQDGTHVATLHTSRPLTFSDHDVVRWQLREHLISERDYQTLAMLNVGGNNGYTLVDALRSNPAYIHVGNVIATPKGEPIAVSYSYVLLKPILSSGNGNKGDTAYDVAALIKEVPVIHGDGTISTRKEIERLHRLPANFHERAVVVPYRVESLDDSVHTRFYDNRSGSPTDVLVGNPDDHPASKRERDSVRILNPRVVVPK